MSRATPLLEVAGWKCSCELRVIDFTRDEVRRWCCQRIFRPQKERDNHAAENHAPCRYAAPRRPELGRYRRSQPSIGEKTLL
jgi:hypothetical protein